MTDRSTSGASSSARRKPKKRYDIDVADRRSWPEVLTLNQVAKILSISPEHARKLIDEGEIEAVKFGGQWRIPRRWLIQRFKLDATPEPSTESADVPAGTEPDNSSDNDSNGTVPAGAV